MPGVSSSRATAVQRVAWQRPPAHLTHPRLVLVIRIGIVKFGGLGVKTESSSVGVGARAACRRK